MRRSGQDGGKQASRIKQKEICPDLAMAPEGSKIPNEKEEGLATTFLNGRH